MFCHDGINFAEDLDTFQFYGLDAPEDLIPLGPMPGHEKQSPFDMTMMTPVYPTSGHLTVNPSVGHYMHSYTSNVTDQNELAVMPPGFCLEFDDQSPYSQAYEYSASHAKSAVPVVHQPVPSRPEQPKMHQALSGEVTQSIKKRKASVDSTGDDEHNNKRVALGLQDTNAEYHDLSGEPSPYSSFVPTPSAAPSFHQAYPSGSPRAAGHQYSVSNASQVSMPAPSPYTPTVSPAFTTANTDHSPRAPATPIARPASVASTYVNGNPKLVRTSTIPQSSPSAIGPCVNVSGQTHSFNPYTMYSPNAKARLTLDGDLNAIAKNWSPEEMEARRKIIVFTRSQKGNEIFASFKAVPQKEWARQPGTVNCIWWKERNDAYVTSVDTIQLLEELVHVRFTVEEKNRIRRNLEGFKPLTVSKAKADSEEFFKVIMGFPNPKPRNIEKDVKVFPWRILPTALCKIISKYSASYASTASALAGGPAQLYRPVELPAEYHTYPPSPGHDFRGPVPTGSLVHGYEPNMQKGRLSTPVTTAPQLQVIPPVGHHFPMTQQYSYNPAPHPVSEQQYHQQAMSAPAAPSNPYWNFNYHPEGAMTMTPHSAPPSGYMPREMIETADFGGIHAAGQVMHR